MSKREHTLWVELYRPDSLEGYVGNENIKQTINHYLLQNDIQNFLFYGPPGCGKTTLAKLIVNNLDCEYLYINASDENGIDTIREKVKMYREKAKDTTIPQEVRNTYLDRANELERKAFEATKVPEKKLAKAYDGNFGALKRLGGGIDESMKYLFIHIIDFAFVTTSLNCSSVICS